MAVLHLTPDFVDGRMTLVDFLLACEFIDDLNKRKG